MKSFDIRYAVALGATLFCLTTPGRGDEPNYPYVNRITYTFEPFLSPPLSGPAGQEVIHYLSCGIFLEHIGYGPGSWNAFAVFEYIQAIGGNAQNWHLVQYAVYHGDPYLHLHVLSLRWTPAFQGNYPIQGSTLAMGGNQAWPNPPGTYDRIVTQMFNAY